MRKLERPEFGGVAKPTACYLARRTIEPLATHTHVTGDAAAERDQIAIRSIVAGFLTVRKPATIRVLVSREKIWC